jgi:hypothetical protein
MGAAAMRILRGLCAIALLALAGRAEAAGTAYGTDTADVGEVGNCKVESWVSFASNTDFIAVTNPSCVADLTRPVELSAQIQRSRSDGEWGTSVAPKFKTNLIPTAIGQWGVALAGGAIYDVTANDVAGFFAYVPATLRLSDVVRINVNAGWQWDRIADRHFATYATGVDWRTPDNVWTLTAEVFGLIGQADTATATQPRIQLGLRWRPIDRFSIDAIYGRNITGENANWITIATSIRFPAPEK